MEVVEFFQDEVQFPCEVIEQVSATLVGTPFLLSTCLFLLLANFLTPSNSDPVDLSFALLYNSYVNSLLLSLC
jgi:hypothetical protein